MKSTEQDSPDRQPNEEKMVGNPREQEDGRQGGFGADRPGQDELHGSPREWEDKEDVAGTPHEDSVDEDIDRKELDSDR